MLQVSLLRPFVLLALLVLTGCASVQGSSHIVGPDRLGEVAAEVAGGQGILSLVDGTRYLVEGLRIEPADFRVLKAKAHLERVLLGRRTKALDAHRDRDTTSSRTERRSPDDQRRHSNPGPRQTEDPQDDDGDA